ncbi:MAG: tRNA pseudouridine(38-40) synthase TruA [Hydrogenophilus sp.]|nr:tRNA pseudouridine(38-40) synthase TruA [Hydrogenophilus sp.]
MARWVLLLSYRGDGFCGWQSQERRCGVQDRVQEALSMIAGERIRVFCAGRTDAGVHAVAQVVHFECSAQRPVSSWVRGVNSLLPAGVHVWYAQEVSSEFHARYSARSRCYRYLLYNGPAVPACWEEKVGWFHRPLDFEAMRRAAAFLVGRHDFSAFRAADCQAKSPIRTMWRVKIRRIATEQIPGWGESAWFAFDFEADGFLHHMVRNIVGALVEVGKGGAPPEWISELMACGERRLAAPTFPAMGLYFCGADYGQESSLPFGGRIVRWPLIGWSGESEDGSAPFGVEERRE